MTKEEIIENCEEIIAIRERDLKANINRGSLDYRVQREVQRGEIEQFEWFIRVLKDMDTPTESPYTHMKNQGD